MSRIGVTPVLSLPDATSWSQVVEYTREHVHFSAVVSVFGVDAKNVGKALVQMMRSADVATAEQCYALLLECVRTAQDARTSLQVASVCVVGSEVVFAAVRGRICLKRGARFGSVLTAGDQVEVKSGRFLPDDSAILATEASQFFLEEVERKYAQGVQTDTIITSITPGVQSADGVRHSALLFLSALPTDERERGDAVLVPSATTQQQGVVSGTDGTLAGSALTGGAPSRLQQLLAPNQDGEQVSVGVLLVVTRAVGAVARVWKDVGLIVANKLGGALQKVTTASVAVGAVARSRLSRSAPLYVGQEQRARLLIWVALGLVVLASAGAGVWWYMNGQQQARQAADNLVAPFSQELVTAQELVATEPLVAREQVARTIATVQNLLKQENLPKLNKQALELTLQKAQELDTAISGKSELSELPVFYDLRLIQSDFVATLAQGGSEQAVFVDRDKQQAAVLNLQTKQLTLISLQAVGQVRSVVIQGDRLFVLGDGVFTIPIALDTQPEISIASGDSNAGGSLLGAYESYIYVLNPEKRNIYRYLKQTDGYSQPVGWLTSSLGSLLDDVTALAIDGDVWLGTKTGEIKQFTSGAQQDFEVKGLSEPFDSALQVVTSVELQRLYILEPDRNRLVVLDKDGTFLREIKNTALGSASALVVSESLGKAFVLSGSLVFEVGL